jgi:hypothetical protein
MVRITWIYRKLFCRKGYGVHSPFVYDLITQVIEEKCYFYAYRNISLIRLQLLQNEQFVHYKGKRITVKKALRRYGISKKEGELLFRLTNYFKPHTILCIGSSLGLIPLYLTRYDSTVQCITLESEPDFANQAMCFLRREENPSLQIQIGSISETVPESIVQFQRIDCIYINKNVEINDLEVIFTQCFPYVHDTAFCVLAGIRSSKEKYHYWKQLCQHPNVTVTIDLFYTGILFFKPDLHKRVYKTIPL